MKKTITIIFLVFLSYTSYSQDIGSANIVGINHDINSKVLKENKNIQVHLPKDYATSNKNYPVIYLLDGQRFFLYGASLYQTFTEFNSTPDFIIVGITNQQSTRMRTFSTGAKDFAEYLEKEVISVINSNYRTSKKRLLFGWAYGGGFGIETLMSKPNLFDGYILSSPYPVSSKIKKLSNFISSYPKNSTYIYFSSDRENENNVFTGTEDLKKLLNNSSTKLRWFHKELSGEVHQSTPYTTLYHGILEYFENYNEVRFKDLNEFNAKGGISFVRNYYKKRANLYNLPNEISPFTKYSMIRLAMRASDFNSFEELYSEFGTHQLIENLRANWACNIADFYIKNKKKQKALKLYQFIAKTFPASKRAQKGLNNLLNK
jgi:predicted alpha/beta superfamily hydrolase